MRMSLGRNSLCVATATILLVAATSAAHADPITSDGYTLTDLGPGTPTIGNGLVITPNGQTAYQFPQTPNTVLTPGQGIMANFPQFPTHSGAGDQGDPAYDFNTVTIAIMNSNGLVVATDQAGVVGHEYNSSALVIQHNTDGSWGQPNTIFGSGALFQTGFGGGNGFAIAGLSKSNEILIFSPYSYNAVSQSLLFNANTNTTTDLSSVISAINETYSNLVPLAIDDVGRIVLSAYAFNA